MDDLISRKAAITAIQNAYCDTDGGEDKCAVWKNVGLTEALHIMQDLPSAQQWISCEERLPENYTDVLVWFEYYRYGDYNRLYQMHGIGTYIKEYNSWIINHETGWRKLRVFAWCPLPEPWKGEQE